MSDNIGKLAKWCDQTDIPLKERIYESEVSYKTDKRDDYLTDNMHDNYAESKLWGERWNKEMPLPILPAGWIEKHKERNAYRKLNFAEYWTTLMNQQYPLMGDADKFTQSSYIGMTKQMVVEHFLTCDLEEEECNVCEGQDIPMYRPYGCCGCECYAVGWLRAPEWDAVCDCMERSWKCRCALCLKYFEK